MRTTLITLAVAAVALWGLVTLLQPKMAFFPYRGVQRTPATFGLSFVDLQIVTSDGVKLHGWWIEHPSPRAHVVYWHGNGGNLSLWLDVLADIRSRGFSVFAVDYRGYGASTGSPTEKGVYRDADAAGAYYVKHYRRGAVRTIYWGRSLGCAIASFSATKVSPDALILESPFPDVRSLFADNPVMSFLGLFSSYRFATAKHLDGYDGPLLVVHGDRDSIIPFSAGKRVYEGARTANKTFAILEGADHNDVHANHPAYWAAVDAFLSRSPPNSPFPAPKIPEPPLR